MVKANGAFHSASVKKTKASDAVGDLVMRARFHCYTLRCSAWVEG